MILTNAERRLFILFSSGSTADCCNGFTPDCCSGIRADTLNTLRQALPDIYDADERTAAESLIAKLDSIKEIDFDCFGCVRCADRGCCTKESSGFRTEMLHA